MPNKKHLSNVHHPAHVLAARAGLIPASDHIENELNLQAARIGRSVSAYARRKSRHDLAITDILQDLRHYCDSKGLAFHELDAAAHEYYLEDVNESPWISRPHAS
jgi:hypothetical protein